MFIKWMKCLFKRTLYSLNQKSHSSLGTSPHVGQAPGYLPLIISTILAGTPWGGWNLKKIKNLHTQLSYHGCFYFAWNLQKFEIYITYVSPSGSRRIFVVCGIPTCPDATGRTVWVPACCGVCRIGWEGGCCSKFCVGSCEGLCEVLCCMFLKRLRTKLWCRTCTARRFARM